MLEMTSDLAEVCGIHAGDGYMRIRGKNKGEVDISGHLEEKDYYDNHVIPLFNKVFSLNIKGKTFSRGSYGFVTYKKEIRNALINSGFPSGEKSKIVSTPKTILDSNDKKICVRFLRGLFDTDGHLGFRKYYGQYTKFNTEHHHYPLIELTTISQKMVNEVSFMLKNLGILHFISKYQPKTKGSSSEYRIFINGVQRLTKWMNIIGFKNSVKLTRYLIWKKFGFCPTNTTLKQREDILNGKLDIYDTGS